jgi:hypothetical protein
MLLNNMRVLVQYWSQNEQIASRFVKTEVLAVPVSLGRSQAGMIKEVQIPYCVEAPMARNWAYLRFFEHPEIKQSERFGKYTRMGMIWSE